MRSRFELAASFVTGVLAGLDPQEVQRSLQLLGEVADAPVTTLAASLERLWWASYDEPMRATLLQAARLSEAEWREAVRTALVVRLTELMVTGSVGGPVEVCP